MSSLIPSSKSGIVHIIFQNNDNQIMETIPMEIIPSRSAYHYEFVTNFFNKNLLIWDLKLNFQRKLCKIYFKNINIF